MKRKITRVIASLIVGTALGACDLEEEAPREFRDVQLLETEDGITLIDGDEEFTFAADEVEIEHSESFSSQLEFSSAAENEPDELWVLDGWECCDVCIPVCCSGRLVCAGCAPCSVKRPTTTAPGP